MKSKLYIICIGLAAALFAALLIFSGAPAGTSAAERSSSNYVIETDVLSSGGATGESTNYMIENSSIGEPFQAGSMESTNYSLYGEFQETCGTSPDAPSNLKQYRANGTTVIATGEWIADDTVVFKFTMSDPDPSNFLTPQVEARVTTDAFTNNKNYSGAEVRYHGGFVTGVVTASGIASDKAYHWQARVMDDEYRRSVWVSFGGNPETSMDFGIDKTRPTVEVILPNGGETIAAASTYSITWTASDPGCGINYINIYYSTNEGASWTKVSTGEGNDGSYPWIVPNTPTSTALVRVQAVNNLGTVGTDESNAHFTIIGPIYPPALLTAEALPADTPAFVKLYWLASTSEAYQGYNVYRGFTYEVYDPTPINGSLITSETYIDSNVSVGTNYYYAVVTYGYGAYSPYSNCGSAPFMKMSRTATVDAPVTGGYTGGSHDSVPGAIIRFTMRYENIGFALSKQIIINDKIPPYTNYKIGSATGEDIKAVRFSSGEGWSYTPAGTNVDPLVTNISWEAQDIGSGASRLCTYEVVIK